MAQGMSAHAPMPIEDRALPVAASFGATHWILRVTYAVLPVITGIDKFFDRLTDWMMYVSPFVVEHAPMRIDVLMHVAGATEIAAGIIVAIRPRIGSLVIVAWLLSIVVNLLLAGGFADIALRDTALAAGALALNRTTARAAR